MRIQATGLLLLVAACSPRDTPKVTPALRGRAIVMATHDSMPDHVGNGLRCTSCHLDEGKRLYAMPWVNVVDRYPQYRSRAARELTIEDRVNECLERSLAGKALSSTDDRMLAIVAYFASLSTGLPKGQKTPGQGIDSVHATTPDTAAGRVVYATSCARCHSADGSGAARAEQKSDATPAWGGASYTIAAGMGRFLTAAAFIRRNMPFDKPGTLTDQQALDVAAYVDAQTRPDYPGKELDWPKGKAPKDVPYHTNGAGIRP